MWPLRMWRAPLLAWLALVRGQDEVNDMLQRAGSLSGADQAGMDVVLNITNDRAKRQLDLLAQRSPVASQPPRVYAADIVGKEQAQFAVVAKGFQRHRLPYADVPPAEAELYWSYGFAFDRAEVSTGLAEGSVLKVNHMPGIAYLAVKSSLCTRLMKIRRELAWFDVSPECYYWGDANDRARLTAHFAKQLAEAANETEGGAAAKPSYWMRKVGSHRNTTLHSTHEPLPEVPPDLAADTIFQKYITNPFLVDEKKMELRLFVAITSVEPLSVYLYKDYYLRVAGAYYDPDLAKTKGDATVHQITGGKMGDIMSQEKWPREEFEEYLTLEGHDPVELMRRVRTVIGLAVMGVEEDMHAEVLKTAPVVAGEGEAYDSYPESGADTRRFYEVVGFDVMLVEVDMGEDKPKELRPTILEVNFNPDPSLYHEEDVGPKGGAWNDVLDLVGLQPGSAPRASSYTTAELQEMTGLSELPLCKEEAVGEPGQEGYEAPQCAEGMQLFPRVYSMRYKRKLFPIKPLTCVTRYDLELIVEHDAELMRARGYEVVLPSADMANYHQFMPSNRYADMVLQRVLVTNRTQAYHTARAKPEEPAAEKAGGRKGRRKGKGKKGKKAKKGEDDKEL